MVNFHVSFQEKKELACTTSGSGARELLLIK